MNTLFRLLVVTIMLAVVALPAQAHEEGTWVLRAGVGTVDPDSDNLDSGLGLIEVDSGTSLVISGTYMFTENWAFDILAAWPFSHDIELDGAEIAETKHLPPTFSVQYHFAPDADFQPYVGLGLNYTTFFDTDTNLGLDLDLDDSFGLAAQVGADWMLEGNWFVNFDLRYINIETDADLETVGDIGTVDINPLVYSINLGYRF